MSFQSDWLSSLFEILEMRGYFGAANSYQKRWQILGDPALPNEIPFYIILDGIAEFESPSASFRRLFAGEVVFLLHGTAHTLRSAEDVSASNQEVQPPPLSDANTHAAEHTKILSGRLTVAYPHVGFIRKYLPESLVVSPSDASGFTASQMEALVRLIHDEAKTDNGWSPLSLNVLASALFAISFRSSSEAQEPPRGLLAVAGCEALAPALEGLVAEPSRRWTLSDLASRCTLSRAALRRRFTAQLGHSPLELLRDIRMAIAANALGNTTASTDVIARAVGFESVAAFRRAFIARFGINPAKWRGTQSTRASDLTRAQRRAKAEPVHRMDRTALATTLSEP